MTETIEEITVPQSPTPIWHPIDKLPLISMLIDEQLTACREQLQNLRPRGPRPVLDDALVKRIIRVHTEQEEMLPVYAEQLSRWKSQKPGKPERAEIERLEDQLDRYRAVVKDVLETAREHEEFTIEKVMSRDDADVGLDFLLGKMDRWF